MNYFDKALLVGRPPSIRRLFPNSKALIVSGKYIDLAMLKKGKAMSIATNGRSSFIIKGALKAAQKANSAIIIEIARSEGTYCPVHFWNIARLTDALCNELHITIPVAIHADHFGIKKTDDLKLAKQEIPSIFNAGITSIAIDASHLPDEENLISNIELNKFIPDWAGYETEIGEIKGKEGLSNKEEAAFLIAGLNAYGIFPNWIALNNGTTHGIEASDAGIQIELTANIHNEIAKYNVSGAQHGTSGNNYDKLRRIASETRTTKANVATALQMISWGIQVNEYGNAEITPQKELIKIANKGVNEETWNDMTSYAKEKGLKLGDFKKLNLPFENKLLMQDKKVQERMVRDVEDFVYNLLTSVFNSEDTADILIDMILEKNHYNPGDKAEKIENEKDWTKEKILKKAKSLSSDKGPSGNFDD